MIESSIGVLKDLGSGKELVPSFVSSGIRAGCSLPRRFEQQSHATFPMLPRSSPSSRSSVLVSRHLLGVGNSPHSTLPHPGSTNLSSPIQIARSAYRIEEVRQYGATGFGTRSLLYVPYLSESVQYS